MVDRVINRLLAVLTVFFLLAVGLNLLGFERVVLIALAALMAALIACTWTKE